MIRKIVPKIFGLKTLSHLSKKSDRDENLLLKIFFLCLNSIISFRRNFQKLP